MTNTNNPTPITAAIEALEKLIFNDFTGHDANQQNYCDECTHNIYYADIAFKNLKAYQAIEADLWRLAEDIQWRPIDDKLTKKLITNICYVVTGKQYNEWAQHPEDGKTIKALAQWRGKYFERITNTFETFEPSHYRPITDPKDYPALTAALKQRGNN